MKPSHGAARYFRDAANVRVGRFGGAPQSDKRIAVLSSFSCGKGFTKFLGNRGGDRTATDRKTARENSSGFDEENVGRARANIHQQRAAAQIGVVVTKCIV